MRRINLTPDAVDDLDTEFDYLADRNPDAARRFYKAAQSTFMRLADMPQIGTLRPFPDPKLEGMRMWPISGFQNYLIFYLFTAESIQVLHILHGARDIEAIFSDPDGNSD